MEGLRNFIEVDNHSALDVGYLKKGTRTFEVRRPKVEEGGLEVSIREGPEELTPRTEEVCSKKSCIDVDHIAHDWHALCQAIYKGIEGSEWEDLYYCIATKK